MVTFVTPSASASKPVWHDGFMAMLPKIRSQITFAFRGFTPETREEAIQESLALALDAYIKLFEKGRADIAYPSVLAGYAARQFRAGRRLGGQLNQNDVLSRHHGIVVERLDRRDQSGAWKELLVEDRRSTPAATAIARIDFGDWLSRLTQLKQRIVTNLANGETTRTTARLVGISDGRISQVRTELRRNWARFQGEPAEDYGEEAMARC